MRDDRQRPVAEALVRVLGTSFQASSDSSGRCRLALEQRAELELEVSAPDHVGLRERRPWAAELELVLPRRGTLRGRTLVREPPGDGTPDHDERQLAGARVHVQHASRWSPEIGETTSAEDGLFQLDGVPLGTQLVVCASAPGFPEVDASVSVDAEEDELVLALEALPAVEVEVREWPADVPIAGAWVNDACTDAAGRVWLAREEQGFEFEATAPGFCALVGATRLAELPTGAPLVLRLPRAAALEGRVVAADGQPVAGARLAFRTEEGADSRLLPPRARRWSYSVEDADETLSAFDGSYRSPSFLPGQRAVRVRASHPDAGDAEAEGGPLGGAGTVTRLDLALAPRVGGTLVGHVRFRDQWVSGAVLWKGAKRNGAAQLDLEGDYNLAGIEAGWVVLEVRAGPKELQGLLPDTQASVFVEAGGELRHDFDLSLPMAEIGGRVVHTDGSPAEDVRYSVSHREPRYALERKSKRGGTWSVLVPDLGWEYELTFRNGHESVRLAGVRAGDTGLEVVLPDLAWLGVLVLDAESEREPESWTLLWRRAGTDSFERAYQYGLEVAPGLVDVRVETPGLGYLPAQFDGVRVEAAVGNTLRILLRRGLELVLEVDPSLDDQLLFLRAPEGSFPPGSELAQRRIDVDAFGAAHLVGLTSGLWRFAAEPDEVRFEPATVRLPRETPLVLRGIRRD
ncbi:MAG: carboxypeptidase regulatory-like domain-containing protein [Planctomycetes bacterium]|nr:carboxypeptidase regulatory-like domain-containing protein [Planctomycetota bacterium]